jgi:hypothetical protein
LCIRYETGVDHVNEAPVFTDRRNHPYMIQAFDANRFPAGLLP